MLFARPAIFTLFFSLAGISVLAQASVDPLQYDAQIDYFSGLDQVDSVLYYTAAKTEWARQKDDLRFWVATRLEAANYLYDNHHDTLWARYLDETLAGKWREPRNAEEWEVLCYLQSNRGTSLNQAGKTFEAITAFEEAARIFELFQYLDFEPLETIYKPLGNCYTRLGDNDKALAVFQKALLLRSDNETMAGLYCDLGIACWNKGDYTDAERYHRQGLALPDVSKLKRALLLGALAQTLLDKGQVQDAARNAAESLVMLADEKPKDRALEYRCYSRRTAGIANTRLGKLTEAERLLSGARADALAVFGKHSRDLGKIEIALAELFLKQGNTTAALSAANRALKAVLPGFQPVKLEQNPDPAGFYEENVLFEALGVKAKAAQLSYEKTGNLAWLTLALDCHDLAWQAETRLRKIFQYSTSKLDLQSSARTREESAMHVVRLLFEKTGQQAYLEKAFAIAERSKASLLGEALHENLIRQRLSDSDPRFATLTALHQSFSLFEKQILLDPDNALVAQWRREADALVVQIKALETAINAAYPSLAEQRLATFSEVSAELQEGETLVEYFVGPASIEAFIFQKNKATTWYSFQNNADLQTLAGKYLAYFENQNAILNDPPGYLNTAFLLWQKLLPAGIADASKLTIVPDGFLNFIPFDALVTVRPDATTSLRNAAYLVRRQEVRYAWSLSVLRQQKSLHSNAKNYALSLAPGFAHGERGLATLQSTPGERPSNSTALLNEAADLQHFMTAVGNFRVLHLSTHAFAAVQGGQLPRLELFDQALFLPSIYALPLQADLVTLSACQTGLGHEQSGEGVMSLARAFAQAGAACVVSSLWSVNDESTSRLLTGFYRNLESGQSIGASLRTAKLGYLNDPEVRATMQSPYFWAGLEMVGDDRVVPGGGVFPWAWVIGGFCILVIWGLFMRRRHR